MDEFYLVVRSTYFIWALLLSWVMIYWGLQDLILARRCGHTQVPMEHYFFAVATLVACFFLVVGLGEIFLQKNIPVFMASILPFFFLAPGTVGTYHGMLRIKLHRQIVREGNCS